MATKINKEAVVDLERTNMKYMQTLENIIKLIEKLNQLHENNIDVNEDIESALEVIKSYTGKELTEARKIGINKILNDVQEEVSVVMSVIRDAHANNPKVLANIKKDFEKLKTLLIKLEQDLKEIEKKF